MSRRAVRAPRRVRVTVLLVVCAVVSCVVGTTVLVATATVATSPAVLVAAGLVALLVVDLGGVVLVTRRLATPIRMRAGAVSGAVLTAGYLVATLVPLNPMSTSPAPVAHLRMVRLSTGSRLAYVDLPARGTPRPTPVVFLHGGPGVPDLAGDSRYFGQLTADGFPVVVYAQLGSGRSSRAADPRRYTLRRNAADLDALRRHLGADRIILIGHSYGARLAATYLVRYPRHVAKVVFSSPPSLSPHARGTSLLSRLTTRQKLSVIAALARPRVLLAYTLLQVNPAAAHALVGDREMDGDFGTVYNRSRSALHCHGLDPGPALHGLGFYANQYPQSAARPPRPDPRPALARSTVPALVIKGSCDYQSWSSAMRYVTTIPHARLVYLSGAGHNAYQDKPDEYLAAVRAFLTDHPISHLHRPSSTPPPSYQGPR